MRHELEQATCVWSHALTSPAICHASRYLSLQELSLQGLSSSRSCLVVVECVVAERKRRAGHYAGCPRTGLTAQEQTMVMRVVENRKRNL